MAEAEAEEVAEVEAETEAEAEAEAEEVAEATSSTSPEVGANARAGRERPWRWRCGGCAKASISFFLLFFAFGWPMAYIPGAPDSLGAIGGPRSTVLFVLGNFSSISLSLT